MQGRTRREFDLPSKARSQLVHRSDQPPFQHPQHRRQIMAPPQYLPTMFELMIEASNLRNKDKLREITKKMTEPQQDPAQDMQQQIVMAAEQAKIEKTQSETAENMAQTQSIMAGIEMNAFQTGAQLAA